MMNPIKPQESATGERVRTPEAIHVRETRVDARFPDDRPTYSREAWFPDDRPARRQDAKFPECGRRHEGAPPAKNLELVEKQKMADVTAQRYNERFRPHERALQKGVDGVTKTANGGVSFENSDAIYRDEAGRKASIRIEATGNRSSDFDAANRAFGFKETPKGHSWHHVDNYDVKTNTFTLQLVKEDVHNTTKPHSGGCAQYDAVHGPTYNPPRKDFR